MRSVSATCFSPACSVTLATPGMKQAARPDTSQRPGCRGDAAVDGEVGRTSLTWVPGGTTALMATRPRSSAADAAVVQAHRRAAADPAAAKNSVRFAAAIGAGSPRPANTGAGPSPVRSTRPTVRLQYMLIKRNRVCI